MADLSTIQAADTVKIVGSDSTGVEQTPVQSTDQGALHTNLRDSSGNEITSTVSGAQRALDVNDISSQVAHINRIDVASAARTASGNSSALDTAGMGSLTFFINITAASGTTPTLQIALDYSEDGTNWSQTIKTLRFTGTTTYRFQRASVSAKYYRYRWIITGTTPSFTFSVTSTLKQYQPKRNVVISEYADISMTAVNNVSTTFVAADANNISIMTIRSADGGNNGQFKVQASNDSVNWADISGNITQGPSTTILTTFASQSFRYYRLIIQAATNAGTRVLDIHWGAS